MKKICSILVILFALGMNLTAQYVVEDVANVAVYEFLDEMAGEKFIELNSAVKPYSKEFISDKLLELEAVKDQLNRRQQKELAFFMKGYCLERNELPQNARWNLIKRNDISLAVLPPAFYYKDSLFRARINPILGVTAQHNANGTPYQRYWGGEFIGMVGDNFAIYGSLRDNHLQKEIMAEPTYLTKTVGGAYKRTNDGKSADFSEMRGGITYAWKWGNLGLVKNHVIWGDNYNGSNILSGRTPSFPMIVFNIKPAKWFELNYIHGFLTSNVIDSTDYYVGEDNELRYRYRNKYIAANMITITPVRGLNIGLGNSIVYAERSVKAGYLIPIMFYKSIDHSSTMGSENQNSQMFLNLSSRNIKHLHLYASIFVDELSVERWFNDEHNFSSFKAGANLDNYPLKNLSVTGEYTYTLPITYKHRLLNTTFACNDFGLGHYLGDNSRELYLAMTYKPFSTFHVKASFSNAQHFNDYPYLDGKTAINTPVMQDKTWTNNTLSLDFRYLCLTNLYINFGVSLTDIKGYDVKSKEEYNEIRLSSQEYLDLYTPKFYQGKNTNFNFGLNYYF